MLLTLIVVVVVVTVSGHYDPANPHPIHTKDGIINNPLLLQPRYYKQGFTHKLQLSLPKKWAMVQARPNYSRLQTTYQLYPSNLFTGASALTRQRRSPIDPKETRLTRKGRKQGRGRKVRGRKYVNRFAQLRNSPVFRNILRMFDRRSNKSGRFGFKSKDRRRPTGKRTSKLGIFGFR